MHSSLAKLPISDRQDTLCLSAIKNSISEFKPSENKGESNLTPVNNGFLQLVLRLTKHITAQEKVLVVLYFVMNHAQEGADQVEAAYECYQYAIKHEKKLAESVKVFVITQFTPTFLL